MTQQPEPELVGGSASSRPLVLVMGAYDAGGSAIYAANLAVELVRLGRRVAVICPRVDAFPDVPYQRDSIRELIARMRAAGVEVHDVERRDFAVRDRVSGLRNLIRLIRAHPHCVVVLVMGYFKGGGRWALAARLAGAHAVARLELATPADPPPLRERLATRLKDMLVDRLVVGSQTDRRDLAHLMPERPRALQVIHTGIDISSYVPAKGRAESRVEMGIGREAIAIGMVARLSDEAKGVRFFLRACALAAGAYPGLSFVVVGDGYLKGEFEAEARSLGVQVLFPGWRSDIVATLAALDIFVMPSSSEGGPTVLIEAMAMALPVIATPVGMVPEIVVDGVSGRVCPYDDKKQLARAITELAADHELRSKFGWAARHHVLEQLTLRRMAERYSDLFDSL